MTRTNAFSILCVFTRAFAMWIFVATIVAAPALIARSDQWNPQNGLLYAAIGSALPMFVAVLVWIFADKLAKVALARPQQGVFDSDVSASEWQTLAFSVVGLWQAFAGIVGLTIHLSGMLIVHAQMAVVDPSAALLAQFAGNIIASCVQLLLGLALMFGARGLVGMLRRFRMVGYTQPEGVQPADTNVATEPDQQPPT